MMLKNYILQHYPKINQTDVLILILKGKVLINNKITKNPSKEIEPTDVVKISLSKGQFDRYEASNIRTYGLKNNFDAANSFSNNKKRRPSKKNAYGRNQHETKINNLLKRSEEIKQKKKRLFQARKDLSSLSVPIQKKLETQVSFVNKSKPIVKKKKSFLGFKTRWQQKKAIKNIDTTIDSTLPALDHIIKTKKIKKNTTIKPLSKSRIIYEDENIIAIFKGQHETLDSDYGRIDKSLSKYLKARGDDVSQLKYHNKLDSETKGIIIFTKNKSAEISMNEIVKKRDLVSIYYAICIPAPFLNDKTHFDLALPFIMNKNSQFVQVKEKGKNQLRRIIVDKVGQITIKGISYPILKIKTNKLREASIRFLLTYYGMTIINERKMVRHKYSDDLILFHSAVKFFKNADSRFQGITIKLNTKFVLKKMQKLLYKTIKLANE